jgi:hypothetical protein
MRAKCRLSEPLELLTALIQAEWSQVAPNRRLVARIGPSWDSPTHGDQSPGHGARVISVEDAVGHHVYDRLAESPKRQPRVRISVLRLAGQPLAKNVSVVYS